MTSAISVDWEALVRAAVDVSAHAYAPYSRYPVGAAARAGDGRLIVGCNVENAALGVVLCAECGVISQLAATGGGRLAALACVNALGESILPCGRCRQLLWEHGGPGLLVLSASGPRPLSDLLPEGFGPVDLARVEDE
jgi:cytidine deaminase